MARLSLLNVVRLKTSGLEKSAIRKRVTLPQHQTDRGSDADYQDTNLRLAENEKVILWQIDRALEDRHRRSLSYGLCEHTQKSIPKNRLTLLPWTPLSIEGPVHGRKQYGIAGYYLEN